MGPVVFVSHTHFGGPFRVGSHHYAQQFARRGIEVLHLSTPLSLLHRPRAARDKLDAAAAGPVRIGTHLTTLTRSRLLPVQVARDRTTAAIIRRRFPGRSATVLIDQPLMHDPELAEVASRVVYRPTDLYPSGVAAHRQNRVLRYADAVVATSDAVLAGLALPSPLPSLVLNNGVDYERFADEGVPTSRRGAVYVGAFDHRFNWQTLVAMAEAVPDEPFRLIGPIGAVPPLPNNVELIGPVPYEAVPHELHRARLGLLPLSASPENEGRSPMKLYEYLAAGLRVLARSTRTLSMRAELGIETYDDDDDARQRIVGLLKNGTPNVAGRREAQAQDWSSRADELLRFLQEVPARA